MFDRSHFNAESPLVLTVPGLNSSGPAHWQSLWEKSRDDCVRVELGMWSRPQRNPWVIKLSHAITGARRPVILCAHSLGCLAVAWWAMLEGAHAEGLVAGALLVAPPDCDRRTLPQPLAQFQPVPRRVLPFPSIVVASRDDAYAEIGYARELAANWGSAFVDAGSLGHINAASGLGDWRFGEQLLDHLIERASPRAGRRKERAAGPKPLPGRLGVVPGLASGTARR